MHLISINYNKRKDSKNYPFNIEIFEDFKELTFSKPVTILVGENGSGKSTLLQGIAAAAQSITIGNESIDYDPSLLAGRHLAQQLRLSWKIKTKRGFFLRAEDFISYTKKINSLKTELSQDLIEIEENYKSRSKFSQNQAKAAYQNSLAALKNKHGDGLEKMSHGESFLEFFGSRFTKNGLYILDEPEAPLSPKNQLVFISMINQMLEQNAQFIIATHSPILMAIPNASILFFENGSILEVQYEDLEHVKITKAFLNNPEAYLRHL